MQCFGLAFGLAYADTRLTNRIQSHVKSDPYTGISCAPLAFQTR